MSKCTIPAAKSSALVALALLGASACKSTRDVDDKRAVEAPSPPAVGSAVAAGPAERPSAKPEVAPKVAEPAESAPDLAPFEIVVPGTTAKLALVPIPAGAIHVADGTTPTVGPFFASTTEITWDMYDAFVFAMDREETEKDPPDAFARPSKPYILMDRGFGHAGYPVISVSFRGAQEFCRWLSAKTGKRFRLPTELEWFHLAGAKSATDPAEDPARLDAVAWFQANSKKRGRMTTRPVGAKESNGFGLFDVHGNAAEWTVADDGTGVLRGGSFLDPAEKVALRARVPDDPTFNRTDPQIPKSVWWLADGPFAGFRVVCDPRGNEARSSTGLVDERP